MKYINATELYRHLSDMQLGDYSTQETRKEYELISCILQAIENMPPADVSENIHSEMKIRLKPCPFCGGHPNIEYTCGNNQVYIICSECGTEQEMCNSLDMAVEAWNQRVTDKISYGKWRSNGYGYRRCSECGFEHDRPAHITPYCPFCGAKMEV